MAEHKQNLYKRVNNLRRDTDVLKNISITIADIVTAVKYHIVENIKPTITENGVQRKVPVHYANPERWVDVQKNGYMRDPKSNQIMVPIIAFRYTGISKNPNIPVDKLDGNLRILMHRKWNAKNRYDVFSVKNKIVPPSEYYSTLVPDFVKMSFDINVWTGYVSHMNEIIENFIYNEGTYWGDKRKNLFKCTIENYDNNVEVTSGQQRMVRNNFTLDVDGYILPKEYKNETTTIKKLNPTKVILGFAEYSLTGEDSYKILYSDTEQLISPGTIDSVLQTLTAEINTKIERRDEDNFLWDLGEYD